MPIPIVVEHAATTRRISQIRLVPRLAGTSRPAWPDERFIRQKLLGKLIAGAKAFAASVLIPLQGL
jgi:hypothetical protein